MRSARRLLGCDQYSVISTEGHATNNYTAELSAISVSHLGTILQLQECLASDSAGFVRSAKGRKDWRFQWEGEFLPEGRHGRGRVTIEHRESTKHCRNDQRYEQIPIVRGSPHAIDLRCSGASLSRCGSLRAQTAPTSVVTTPHMAAARRRQLECTLASIHRRTNGRSLG